MPKKWLTQAMPRQIDSVTRRKSSWLRPEAIRCRKRGITRWLRRKVMVSRKAARASAETAWSATSPGEPPPIGRSTIIGTMQRSCMIRMPTATRPESVSRTPCCIMLFRTTAVLLSATMQPTKTAIRSGQPNSSPAPSAARIVRTICRLPPPMATLRMRRKYRVSNSSPMVNIRRRTPISARVETASPCLIRPSSGPSRTPEQRYPTTGGSRSLPSRKTTAQATARMTTRSPIRSTDWFISFSPVPPPRRYNDPHGGMAERFKAAVLKTVGGRPPAGSNPAPSAKSDPGRTAMRHAMTIESSRAGERCGRQDTPGAASGRRAIRKRSAALLAGTIASLLATGAAPRAEDPAARARRIHREAIVVDTHLDAPYALQEKWADVGERGATPHFDIPRAREGGLTAPFFAIYVPASFADTGGAAREALDLIDLVGRVVAGHPRDLTRASSVADIRRAKKEGRIAVLMGIE